jgi:hypothetical protein
LLLNIEKLQGIAFYLKAFFAALCVLCSPPPPPMFPHHIKKYNSSVLGGMFSMENKIKFLALLEYLRSLHPSQHMELKQRHEKWIDMFREQVDLSQSSTSSKVKRVINVHELAELLTLVNEVSILRI